MPKPIRFLWVDRRTSIVVHNRRAVRLGLIQFAIFDAIHRRRDRDGQMTGNQLRDLIYHGVGNPPQNKAFTASIHYLNRKLSHVGLRVRGVNRGRNSFYQIVRLPEKIA